MQKFKQIYGIEDVHCEWRDSPLKRKNKFTSSKKSVDYQEVAKSNKNWVSNLRDSPERLPNMNFSLSRKKSTPLLKADRYFTARPSIGKTTLNNSSGRHSRTPEGFSKITDKIEQRIASE